MIHGTILLQLVSTIGIEGKTNHSLRATEATVLFQANVPEKIIQERTGHRNLKSLRQYERTTLEQHQEVSMIVAKQQTGNFEKFRKLNHKYLKVWVFLTAARSTSIMQALTRLALRSIVALKMTNHGLLCLALYLLLLIVDLINVLFN